MFLLISFIPSSRVSFTPPQLLLSFSVLLFPAQFLHFPLLQICSFLLSSILSLPPLKKIFYIYLFTPPSFLLFAATDISLPLISISFHHFVPTHFLPPSLSFPFSFPCHLYTIDSFLSHYIFPFLLLISFVPSFQFCSSSSCSNFIQPSPASLFALCPSSSTLSSRFLPSSSYFLSHAFLVANCSFFLERFQIFISYSNPLFYLLPPYKHKLHPVT